MTLRMKIDDLFRIGDKTIFVGKISTDIKAIANIECSIQIDGKQLENVIVKGEVKTGTSNRDLWIESSIKLTKKMTQDHDVWLISV